MRVVRPVVRLVRRAPLVLVGRKVIRVLPVRLAVRKVIKVTPGLLVLRDRRVTRAIKAIPARAVHRVVRPVRLVL